MKATASSKPAQLQVGDVFALNAGEKIYASVPSNCVYSNVTSKTDKSRTTHDIRVGEDVSNGHNTFKTKKYIGQYVVTETRMEGGGTAMFNDYYPNGWHVKAKKLDANGTYNDTAEEISFYQSGAFTAMIETKEVIRKMKRKVTFA